MKVVLSDPQRAARQGETRKEGGERMFGGARRGELLLETMSTNPARQPVRVPITPDPFSGQSKYNHD